MQPQQDPEPQDPPAGTNMTAIIRGKPEPQCGVVSHRVTLYRPPTDARLHLLL
jgi:hypothetical protein